MEDKLREFEVTINQKWSETYKVKAKTQSEARRKAWEKFKPKRSLYELIVDLYKEEKGKRSKLEDENKTHLEKIADQHKLFNANDDKYKKDLLLKEKQLSQSKVLQQENDNYRKAMYNIQDGITGNKSCASEAYTGATGESLCNMV